jgi:uncharacterized membrane protein YczE
MLLHITWCFCCWILHAAVEGGVLVAATAAGWRVLQYVAQLCVVQVLLHLETMQRHCIHLRGWPGQSMAD